MLWPVVRLANILHTYTEIKVQQITDSRHRYQNKYKHTTNKK